MKKATEGKGPKSQKKVRTVIVKPALLIILIVRFHLKPKK